jgi:hypothetical protein
MASTSIRALLAEKRQAREIVCLPVLTQPLIYQGPPRLRKKGKVVVAKPPTIPVRTTLDSRDKAPGVVTLRTDVARVLDQIFGDDLADYRRKAIAKTNPDLADLQEFRREHSE